MEEKIINLTMHNSTPDQKEAGVTDLNENMKAELNSLLVFDSLPTKEEIRERAKKIAEIGKATGTRKAMIGGAPYLMGFLEEKLRENGITPLYAFSVRKSVEREEKGKIVKTQIFEHLGFIEV